MPEEETLEVKILKRCRIKGETFEKGKKTKCSRQDARLLVATNQAEFVDKKNNDKNSGLTTESMKEK